jgi:sulfonate transport system substrate-binding protein
MTNRRPRRIVPFAAVLLTAGLAAAACSSAKAGGATTASPGSAVNLSAVTLRVGDQKGTGAQALLTAAGLISKLPFKIAWSDFTSGPPMLQAMGGGSIDIGGVGNAPPVFAAAGGENIAVVGALQANPLGSAIVVPKGSPITSIAQLRGKRIAVAQGSSADYHVLTVLKKAGLAVRDVTLDYLQPAEALAAFNSGHVDAWDIWSPYIEQVVSQDNARAVVSGTGFGSPYSFTVASRAALGDSGKVAAIRAYLTLLGQAHAWANAHLQAWASVWAQATGLPGSIMLTAAKDDYSTQIPVTPAVLASEQQVADAFYAAGLVPAKVNFSSYADLTFNSVLGSS